MHFEIIRVSPTDDGPEQEIMKTTGDATITKIWQDIQKSIWLESNDGTQIVIPFRYRKFIGSRIKGK